MRRKASLIWNTKLVLPSGEIIQIKVRQLPTTTVERPHGLKYSLFFGRPGERVIAYDNEAGKGDHRHFRDTKEPYRFETMQRLVDDFLADVRKELEDG